MDEKEIFKKLIAVVHQYRKVEKTGKVLDYHTPADLRKVLKLDDTEGHKDWDQIFSWIEKYLKYSVKTHHPRFLNRMWTGSTLPSIVGEFVTTLAHTSACTFESAPVSTEMEKFMIRKMLDLVEFKNGDGQMTTGSSNANMIAMMAARNLFLGKAKQEGLLKAQKLTAFVNEEAHYSMDKAANILGIGEKNVIKIPMDEYGRMRPQILEEKIRESRERGELPFFVGATAGTTLRGAYDPITEILALRKRHGFWLHVDGAWGGSVFLSEKLRRKFLPGLSDVDSFTWDFHKMHGVSLICNMLLFNNRPGLLCRTCQSGEHHYIFREQDEGLPRDLGVSSLQCGRHVDILKLFLNWKFYGQQGMAQRLGHFLEMCEYAEKIVRQTPELEMTCPRESFNVCFRFKTPASIDADAFNLELRTQLYHQGIALVGFGYLKDRLTLRLLICHHEVTREDIDLFFHNLVDAGKKRLLHYHQT